MESASAQGLTDISMGTKLSDVLQQSPESFSAIVVGLVTVGEEAASLPEVLHMLSQSLDQDTEHRLEVLSAMTEPILMSIVAIAVALIVVGIALPMYGLVNSQL